MADVTDPATGYERPAVAHREAVPALLADAASSSDTPADTA